METPTRPQCAPGLHLMNPYVQATSRRSLFIFLRRAPEPTVGPGPLLCRSTDLLWDRILARHVVREATVVVAALSFSSRPRFA